jgi:hypothetical protein
MIQIPSPALAINDDRVDGHIRVQSNVHVYSNDSRQYILNYVVNTARATPGGRLKSLVLNCHGQPGCLIMGEGFWAEHTHLFQAWRGLVDTIWITACRIASRVPEPRMPKKSSDGFLFCQQIAMNARCNVVASLHEQVVPNKAIPEGSIDNFEGRLLCWKHDGTVAWTRMYSLTTNE